MMKRHKKIRRHTYYTLQFWSNLLRKWANSSNARHFTNKKVAVKVAKEMQNSNGVLYRVRGVVTYLEITH